MSERVKRGSSAEDVYKRLRDLIVEGVYQPNDRLPHPQIMRALNAGRTPVREALSRLQSEGLVVISPNRGATVAPVLLESLEEAHVLRLLIEPPLLEAGLPRMGRKQIGRLRELLSQMEETAAEPAAFVRAHRQFHTAIRSEYTNPIIDEIVHRNYIHIHRHQQHMRPRTADPQDFISLDRETLAAIDAGDGRRARQAFQFHLADGALSLLLGEDPDNPLALLGPVARTIGMHLLLEDGPPFARPIEVRWENPAPELSSLTTANLHYRRESDPIS